MKILLLGGSGFLGKNLEKMLVGQGCKVSSLSRTAGDNPQVDYIVEDFYTMDWKFIPKNYDAIFLLVNQSYPRDEQGEKHLESNINGTLRLCEALKNNKNLRLVFFSSGGAVYGNNLRPSILVTDELQPISFYGLQKKMIESVLSFYRHSYHLDSKVLRISNPYGPGQRLTSGVGFITSLATNALLGKPTYIIGDGENVRDYIYVDDVISSCLCVLKYRGAMNTFNIGTGRGYSNNQLIQIFKEITGLSPDIIYLPQNSGDVRRNVLDITLTTEELKWSPRVEIHEGIKKWTELLKSTLVTSKNIH